MNSWYFVNFSERVTLFWLIRSLELWHGYQIKYELKLILSSIQPNSIKICWSSFGRVETFYMGYLDRFTGVVFPLETLVESLSSVASFCLCVCLWLQLVMRRQMMPINPLSLSFLYNFISLSPTSFYVIFYSPFRLLITALRATAESNPISI